MGERKMIAVVGAVAAMTVLVGACACGTEGSDASHLTNPPPQGDTDQQSYTLGCPSPIGELTTELTYTVTDNADPVPTGTTLTYRIEAPLAQVKAPITPTFESSTVTFAIPQGFNATDATMDPTSNSDFASATAQLADGNVSYTLTGDFSLNGDPRQVPTLVVTGTVTAAAGSSITWMTPTSVDGTAKAGIFGSQSSSCTFGQPGPIATTKVVG
jgi:hypothetical protein